MWSEPYRRALFKSEGYKIYTSLIYVLLIADITCSSVTEQKFFFSGEKPSVCYDFYGCFSNEYPFNRTHIPLPESPAAISTRFLLFTRQTSYRGEWINSIPAIKNSHFNASRSTIVIIHGFAGFTCEYSFLP